MIGKRSYREKQQRAYSAILAASGPGSVFVAPILIEPRRCPSENCDEYLSPDEETCAICLGRDEVPPECRGELWEFLKPQERLVLLGAFKGWRVKRADPCEAVVADLVRRCDAGEFETLADLESAWRKSSGGVNV